MLFPFIRMEVNMTIEQAIAKINSIKPNTYTDMDKLEWLNELDGRIKAEIVDTHEDEGDVYFFGYNEDTDFETELIVPSPYDDVYIKWLESKIDYANNEYAKYNNTSTAFNNAYQAFERYYNRQHMPKAKHLKFF